MSQLSAILEVLKDGRPHSVAEIHRRAGTSRLNSRISDLRRAGYDVRCSTVKGRTNSERYVYKLVGSGGCGSVALGTVPGPPPDSFHDASMPDTSRGYEAPPERPVPSPGIKQAAPQLSLLEDVAA